MTHSQLCRYCLLWAQWTFTTLRSIYTVKRNSYIYNARSFFLYLMWDITTFPWLFGNFVGILWKSEGMGCFGEFYELESFERSVNTNFIVLISKKGSAKDLKDFLVGGPYKLLAKILPNWLKKSGGKSGFNFLTCICGGSSNFGCGFYNKWSLWLEVKKVY